MMKNTILLLLWVFSFYGTSLAQTAQPPRNPLRVVTNTQYTDRSELFAEFRPLVQNTAGRFNAHLTRLGDVFTAYADAEVTLTMMIGDKTVWNQTVKQPEIPGIYRFAIKSELAGTAVVMIEVKTPTYTDQFTIKGFTVYADQAAAIAGQAQVSTRDGSITYTKEKSWAEQFATAPVKRRAVRIPKMALISENGLSYVLLQRDPEHFIKKQVQTGRVSAKLVKIKSGLAKGDRIVVLGVEKVK